MRNPQQSSATLETPVFAELLAFSAVAELQSFTAAAQRLQRDVAVVSRRVNALEQRLGLRLVARTTRSVTLTEAGTTYLLRARDILRAIDEADREVGHYLTGEPRGHLRVSLPDGFGRLWITPLIGEFLKAHPLVTMEAEFSNRYVDVVGERFDLAVRLGELADSRLVARRLCGRQRVLCAAPDYLARHGTPRTPQDLAHHACLIFSRLPGRRRWELTHASKGLVRVEVSGPLESDDAQSLLHNACAGLGIVLAVDWLAGPGIRSGELVQVLPRWRAADEGAIYVVTPTGSAATSKTRAFSDWLADRFAHPPWAIGAPGARVGRAAAP